MKYIITLLIFWSCTMAEAQTATKWAGKAQNSGNTTNGATLANVSFNKPWGMAYDKDSNIWITQEGSHVVTMYRASDKKFYVRAGKLNTRGYKNGTSVNAQFDSPKGIAVGSKIYVADAGNHCIRQIDLYTQMGTLQSTSLLAGSAGNSGAQNGTGNGARFNSPTDVAVDSKGNIYVADQQNHAIRMITTKGVVTTFAGQLGQSGSANGDKDSKAEFNWPTGLYIDGDDNVYVADLVNQSIRKIDASTGNVSTVYKGLWTPHQVYIDPSGNILATNACQLLGYNPSFKNDTLKLNSSPFLCGYANGTGTSVRLKEARSMLPLSATKFLVADRDNHCFREVTVDPCSRFSVEITAKGPTTFCEGGSVDLSATSGLSYQWQWPGGSAKTATVQADTSGWYSLIATESNSGCKAVDSIEITENPNPTPSIQTSGSTDFCPGDDVTLSADQNYSSYTWSIGGSSKDLVVSTAETNITLSVTDANGCKGTSAALSTTVYKVQEIEVPYSAPTFPHCDGDTFLLEAVTGFNNYRWNTGAQGRELEVTDDGNFVVTAEDANGCTTTSSEVEIVFNEAPATPDIVFDIDSLYTNAQADDYNWYKDGDLQSMYNGEQGINPTEGLWYVVVFDSGCNSASEEIEVEIVGKPKLLSNVGLYPNPASERFFIEMEGENPMLQLMTLDGKLIHSTVGKQMHIATYPNGLYVLRITTIEGNKQVLVTIDK